MNEPTESTRHLQQIRNSSLFRWAAMLQWLGIALFLLAVGLALLTDIHQEVRGVLLIAVLSMLGLMSLVPARFILTVQLMTPAGPRKARPRRKPPVQ
ncbi:hypothetical protein M2D63_001460 [Pseudomonas sp. BJa5]|uniref:hypothetical protein n=1 Tax=Pseudomonas sp. BJa5 TaxID=2936270 RepID=UPI0025594CB4|nr:hypothetical protein [Pseudomonas sp. BGr12]MDL2419784.1 hypothetical protein [Pseudomonas sp. BGr12]